MQGAAVPHAPDELQVWTLLPEHWVAPGVHTPVQAPARQAWFVHGTGVPKTPPVVHVCTAFPEHWVAPGLHTPVQAPGARSDRCRALPRQVLLVPHVWRELPLHVAAPGVHVPVQAPLTHA